MDSPLTGHKLRTRVRDWGPRQGSLQLGTLQEPGTDVPELDPNDPYLDPHKTLGFPDLFQSPTGHGEGGYALTP